MSMGTPPVIVIGMHRSGTSALTRLLQQSGLFMGRGASRNEEAGFTNAVNAWLFRQASATWDRPESVDELLADDAVRPALGDYVGGIVRGPASLRFLGPRRWWRWRGLDRVGQPWGWKDPRNTWTLPVWLELFPDARVLHIVRHGVPVAESLRVRRERAVANRLARYRRRRVLSLTNPLAPKRNGFGGQPRCRTLKGGFSLWEAYVQRARSHVEAAADQGLELRYEDLVAEPRARLQEVLAFCGVEGDPARIDAAVAELDPGRARAWRGDAHLCRFADEVADRLQALGYDADGRN
jgi:hypothetical protein